MFGRLSMCVLAAALWVICCPVGARADLAGDSDADRAVELEDSVVWEGARSGDALEFIATEDAGFSDVSSEVLVNRGKSTSIRCKTSQEMVIIKFDLSSLAGWTVDAAELHVCASSASLLYAADVSTINVPWTEGNRTGGFTDGIPGECCWAWRQIPVDVNNPQAADWWTYPGSDFTSASYGNNGSIVSFAHPAEGRFSTYVGGDGRTWYRIKVDPDVIHGMILDQYGLTLCDTRGYLLQNNTVYTRDQNGNPGPYAPKLYVTGAVTDTTGPGPISGFGASAGGWTGEALLSWTAPTDSGPTGRAFGYDVRYSTSAITEGNFGSATPVARWRIPRPVAAGQTQEMLAAELTPGTQYYFAVRAYDQAGNHTAIATAVVSLPAAGPVTPFAYGGLTEPAPAGQVPSVPGVVRYWACPDLTKVNPVTGNRMEDGYSGSGAEGYKKSNAVWDAVNNKVVLRGARNEVVAFQLILQRLVTSLADVTVSVSDLAGPGGATIASSPNVELFRCWYVPSSGLYYPDACIPLFAPFPGTFTIPDATNAISGQTNQSVFADIYVPTATVPGTYTGTITVANAQLSPPLSIGVELVVRSWQLPDTISFDVDLNGYHEPWDWVGTGNWQRYLDCSLRYFQLGQKHRCNVNTVPNSHTLNSDKSPRVDWTRTPTLTGSGATTHVDPNGWGTFDQQFGRYLDGSAFTPAKGYNGPGMNTPVPAFYLPIFDSWPLSSYFYYDANGLGGAYWYTLWYGGNPPLAFLQTAPAPHLAYPSAYETGVKNVVRDFAEHAQASGWHGTYLQIYLNNKYSYGTLANPHSQFWNLDEPSEGDCFAALGLFNRLYAEGAASANAPDVKFHFRVDISTRTGQSRGQLDDRVNLWDCSGIDEYHGMIRARKYRFPQDQWWYYGGGPSAAGTGIANSQRFLQAWGWGVDGALPYWNNFNTNWTAADELAIVYSGQNVPGYGTYDGALASVRMKQMRRGQQDIEYLAYLANAAGWDRGMVTRALQQRYGNSGGESYTGMTVLDFYKLREDIEATLQGKDSDGDGLADTIDNCPLAANPTQLDTDGDWMGDACDPDDDNDGLLDGQDNCPLLVNPDQTDTDEDGIGDDCDDDDDNDGVVDGEDLFPLDPGDWSDVDGDGIGDNADLDDDNDGYPDVLDAFPLDPSEWLDTDGDGIGNNADPDDDNDGVLDEDDPAPLNPYIPNPDAGREITPEGSCGACGASSPVTFAMLTGLWFLARRRRTWWS